MTQRYAVIRFGGGGQTVTGEVVPVWQSLSSVMLEDADEARAFAERLDLAQVFELVPVTGLIGTAVGERGINVDGRQAAGAI